MRRMIDPRGLLLTTAVSLGLSLLPIYIAGGVLYVASTVKRRPDLSISALSFGGALTAILPACVLAVAVSPFGMRVIDGREVRDPSVFVLVILFATIGAFFGCIGAVVYAMWDEARFLRRNRQSDTPRALPRSRRRKI
jgi:membrane associated rhomboid family serine protease